jgi:hypothetical protein
MNDPRPGAWGYLQRSIAFIPGLDKTALTDPSGENVPRYIISDHVMSEEAWIRERCGE